MPVPYTQTQYNLDPVGNWNSQDEGRRSRDPHAQRGQRDHRDRCDPARLRRQRQSPEDDAHTRYAYDEENRLTAVHAQFRFRDRRTVPIRRASRGACRRSRTRRVSPATTRYFYDDARIIEEQDTAGATQATYVYGNYVDEVLTMDRGGQTFYYHQNALWSVEAITNGAAAVVERYSYDAYGLADGAQRSGRAVPLNAWGTPHSAIGNPWMFTGRQLDEESGLYFYRARYYDAIKGRFLQRDLLGYVDSMNLYFATFVPNGVDPYGLWKRNTWTQTSGKATAECDDTLKGLAKLITGDEADWNLAKAPGVTTGDRKSKRASTSILSRCSRSSRTRYARTSSPRLVPSVRRRSVCRRLRSPRTAPRKPTSIASFRAPHPHR